MEPQAQPYPVADLPLAVSSFGAAAQGGSIYVYGGHIGRQHQHSFENLSQLFLRYPISDGTGTPAPGWLALPPGPPLQGTALVDYETALYRVGGMRANNPKREPEELYSVRNGARFLPAENRWQRLPELPAGRSSHDLAVLGHSLVVAGGSQSAVRNAPVISTRSSGIRWRTWASSPVNGQPAGSPDLKPTGRHSATAATPGSKVPVCPWHGQSRPGRLNSRISATPVLSSGAEPSTSHR